MQYDFIKIEAKWQKYWQENGTYEVTEDDSKPKFYCLDMFPYPSGSGLHVGHPKGYVGTDVYSRFKRMQGYNVLHPMGLDAFGLPAENYAIKTGVHPEESTKNSIATFKKQIAKIGLSYDWSRDLATCNPDYYRWTQWLFLQMFKKGMAYQKEAPVNWCNSCQTVLANEQVVNGQCERCDNEVVQKNMKQWFFKITDYTERLLNDLEKIDWPHSTKMGQTNWIGKKEGINIHYQVDEVNEELICFTTRPDTNFGATFVVLAPEHDFVTKYIDRFPEHVAVKKYVQEAQRKTELERMSDGKQKSGAFTGWYVTNQLNNKKLPIYVGDFVLAHVGTGAVVGVPGHDLRDFEFAQAMGIDIVRVVISSDGDTTEITDASQVQEEEGTMINSEFLDGMDIHEANKKMMDYLEEKAWGKRIVHYKLRDWLVSRQRYWGCPIPIVYDPEGNPHPVDESDLPVLLPKDVDFKPTGQSPLVYSEAFQSGVEEKYGKGWKREVDTMDTFVDSSWYFFRYTDPHNEEAFADSDKISHWLPVDIYVGGAEHTVLHLLYARFFTKFLYDEGYIDFDEPFMSLRHQGMIMAEDGRKMSKRWGNVINPDDVISTYGADSFRMYEMFMGPFTQRVAWSTQGLEGVFKFINRFLRLFDKEMIDQDIPEQTKLLHKSIKKITHDIENFQFNTAISQMMIMVNELTKHDSMNREVLYTFTLLISPFAPHLAEELYHEVFNKEGTMSFELWPEYDETLTVDDEITLVVQVNGKIRGEFTASRDVKKEDVLLQAKTLESVKKYLAERDLIKEIYVPGKLVSFVVK